VCVFGGGSFNGSNLNLQDNWCIPFNESSPINLELSGSVAFSPKPGFLAYSLYYESDVVIISPDLTTYYKGPGTLITDDILLNPIDNRTNGSMDYLFKCIYGEYNDRKFEYLDDCNLDINTMEKSITVTIENLKILPDSRLGFFTTSSFIDDSMSWYNILRP